MKPIQILLTALLALLALAVWLNRGHGQLVNRLIVGALALLGIVMVLAPDLTTGVAEAVGVGRGADLLLYLAVIGFAFVSVLLYARLRELEWALTQVVRSQALAGARAPEPETGPGAESSTQAGNGSWGESR